VRIDIMRLPLLATLVLLSACAGQQNMTLETTKLPVVAGDTATVPGCPDWSDADVATSVGATSHNYGCATNANLAAMIADPQDLVRGRAGDAGLDGRVSVKAIDTWRKARPTGEGGLKAESVKNVTGGGSN
jgi:pilus assembly protein CpaD